MRKRIVFFEMRRKAMEAIQGNWAMFTLWLIVPSVVFLLLIPNSFIYVYLTGDIQLSVFEEFMVFVAVSVTAALTFTFTAAMYAVIFHRHEMVKNKFAFFFTAANIVFVPSIKPILITKVLFSFLSFLCTPAVFNRIYELLLLNVVDYTFFSMFMYVVEIAALIVSIYVSLAYILTPCVIADNPKLDGITAMKISRKLMQGRKLNMVLFILYFIPWYMLGACALIIGAFFTEACFLVSLYFYYRECNAYESE